MTGLRPRSLSEYAELLWRKKLFILLTAAVVLLATWIVIKRLPNLYEARALVVVAGLRGDEGRHTMATEISLITKQLESRAMLESLIQRRGLYPGLPRDAQVGQMTKALKLETKMRGYYPDSPEAVALSFRYPDAAIAQLVLKDVVALFTETNELTARQAAEEARTIESKLAKIEGQLRRQSPRSASPRLSIDPQTARAERLAATATVASLEDKQYALERRIEAQQREIAEQQKLVQQEIAEQQKLAKSAPPSKQNGAQGILLVRKAELEGQLKDYATQYTEKNPKVVQTRNQLAEVNRQLEQLNTPAEADTGQAAATTEARELRVLQRDLSRLQTEFDVTQRELNRRSTSLTNAPLVGPSKAAKPLPAEESGQTGLAKMAYLQDRYVSLLDKQDRLQMALAAPIEGGLAPFRVVDPPSLPLAPFGPNRTKLGLIALALALAIGLGAAVVVEAPRMRRIQDERDAEYFLGAPVVGMIPETLTPDERGHQRRLLLTRRLALLALAVAAVPLLVILIYQLGVVQLVAFR